MDASSLELEAARELENLIARNVRILQDQDDYAKAFNAAHQQHEALLAQQAEVLGKVRGKQNRLAAYRYFEQQITGLDIGQLAFSPYLCSTRLDHATIGKDGM